MEKRRYEFKIYPNKSQEEALETTRLFHKDLYNAALQERIDYYRKTGKSISCFDQCNYLSEIREISPDWNKINYSSMQQTLRRLDKAYKSFYRRVAKGQTAGFPRFKSKDRYPGFDFVAKDGFKFEPNDMVSAYNWKDIGRGRMIDNLVTRFWNLRSSQRFSIMKQLGVLDDASDTPETEMYRQAFLNAKEANLLDKVSEAIVNMENE